MHEEIVKLMQELSDADSYSEIEHNSTDKDRGETSCDSEFIIESNQAISLSSSSESTNGFVSTSSNSAVPKNAKAEINRRSKGNMIFNVIQTNTCKEIASDGTVWKVENTSNTSGRRPLQNILRENAGSTSYAKCHICSDHSMIFHQYTCNTEVDYIAALSAVKGVLWLCQVL
ncbi:hypothetical protein X975_05888, partial [Stegodyphus mimosarum]